VVRVLVRAGYFSPHSRVQTRPTLGPIQPPILWIQGALFLGIKRPGCEADHSPPSSAQVENAWSYNSTPPICLHGVVLSDLQIRNVGTHTKIATDLKKF
jgi:hypothetical protein